MTKRAVLFAHADGDGHLAAEQSRRNLVEADVDVRVIVHPEKTRSWRFWLQHFQDADFGDAETVYVVDIMLGANDRYGCYRAMCERIGRERDRRFVVIDHHPVSGLPKPPSNMELRFVPSVFECCVGKPEELMLIASICDSDEAPVKSQITETHRRRARGVARAVSERRVLAGGPILKLLAQDFWGVFEQLAEEPSNFHRTFYGNRLDRTPMSPLLQLAYAVHGAS